MCNAAPQLQTASRSQSTVSTVRFAMKLPRCGPFASNGNASSAAANATASGRSRDSSPLGRRVADEMRTTDNTPRASGRGGGLEGSHHSSTTTVSCGNLSNMRRVHSANCASARRRSAGGITQSSSIHKSRSHSHSSSSTVPRRSAQATSSRPTEELPIPPSKDGTNRSIHTVDKGDLTRMYDYATWNMYERIVNARRQRLSQVNTMSAPSSPSDAGGAGPIVRPPAANVETKKQQQQPLYKLSIQGDESSTAATADETDKSSTASSSWSRNDSPKTLPSGLVNVSGLVFPHFEAEQRAASCPPSAGGEDEDHFIFQLDM